MNIGATIAYLRTAGGMSQQELADLLHVSRTLVSKWETGLRTPDYQTVEQIADIFHVSPDQFIDRNDLIFKELDECVSGIRQIPRAELTAQMNGFLQKLPVKSADIFLERYYFLKTTAEIADEYHISENHVRSILSKTRKKLNKYISKYVKEGES